MDVHSWQNTFMKQSRTVSNNSVTFPTLPQIVAWTDGYMVCKPRHNSVITIGKSFNWSKNEKGAIKLLQDHLPRLTKYHKWDASVM